MMFNMNELGESLNRSWDSISQGWNHLINRAGNALTHFKGSDHERTDLIPVQSPHWGLMSAEVFDDAEKVVVRLEVPGLSAEDFDISVVDNVLNISGEKRFEREKSEGQYHVLERAYGKFSRSLPLNYEVDGESAKAHYKGGVLRLELNKKPEQRRRRIEVH
jgi:HSP20 family protein